MIDKSLLLEYMNEELTDERKYKILSEELKKDYPEFAGIFRDLAKEEHSHSKLIEHMINKIQ